MLTYNGTVPGPTLRLRPGDRLQVELVNRLSDPTNLHTHGLHVSPKGNADNTLDVHVQPGESFRYDIQLPDDHPPGPFWYHPHEHHLTADQIWSGLYGGIVVEDAGPQVPVTQDRVLVVSDVTLDDAGHPVHVAEWERKKGREGQLVLVNGQLTPTLEARPGSGSGGGSSTPARPGSSSCGSRATRWTCWPPTSAGSPSPVGSTRSRSSTAAGSTSW